MGRDDLVSSGVPDAAAWWAEPGRAGFEPDAASGVAYPWLLAGHVRGAWAVEDPDLPELGPFPGLLGVQTPLGWMDSLRVENGVDEAWDGFDATLAKARIRRSLPSAARARTRSIGDLTLGSGSDALDGNGLTVSRGDSASWWRTGALSWARGGLGDLGPAGRHHYSFAGAWKRGRGAWSGAIAQAGSAAELVTGESETATGAGGALRYGLGLAHSEVAVELARGYDHQESFGGMLSASRRDAHQRRATMEWATKDDVWGARLEARDQWVTRATTGSAETPWTATSVWLAGRVQGRRGPAWVEASLGAGRHDADAGTEYAPSLRMRFGEKAWTTTLHAGRVLTPVWSDLAPGQTAFLQSNWNGGAEVSWRGGTGRGATASWVMGRTQGRAVASRAPMEELWLREGLSRDPSPFDFGLATASGDWRVRSFNLHGEVFSLLRDDDAPSVALDPRRGGRASIETSFRAFVGDLGVRVRAEVAGVAGHETPAPNPAWSPGYLTYGVNASLSLLDATVTFRVRNLENQPRELPWLIPGTDQPALGAGLEFRLGVAWRLYN